MVVPVIQSNLVIRVLDSIHQADREEWNSLRPADHYSWYEYFVALERSELSCKFYYVVVESDNRIVGYSFGYLYDVPIRDSTLAKVVIVGSPFNVGTPVVLSRAIDSQDALRRIMREWESLAKRCDAVLLAFRDLWPGCPMEQFDKDLVEMKFQKNFIFLDARLSVEWSTLAELISCLRAKVRNALRHDLKLLEQKGYSCVVVPGQKALHHAEQMQNMWLKVYERHRDPDQLMLPVAYFKEMLELPYSQVLCVIKGGILVAYAILYDYGNLLEASYCGVDYEIASGDPVQRTLVTHIVKYGIDQKYQEIDLGISNETVKSRLGASFLRLHAYAKSLDGCSNVLEQIFPNNVSDPPIVRAFRIPNEKRS